MKSRLLCVRILVCLLVFNVLVGVGFVSGATLQSPDNASVSATTNSPNVIFQKGTVANATIYTNSTSAAATTPTTYFPTTLNTVTGTHTSGTVPGSVNAIDSNYVITASTTSGNPKAAETEYIFPVSTATPLQLNFTIVEQYDLGSIPVTIQVFNYTANTYPTSGQGQFTYTSSATPGTDETQSLTITTGPQTYVSGSQQVKVKILGSKNGGTFSQKVNFVRLFYYQSTYDYILKIVNQQATSYSVKLDASPFTPSGISRISNFTAWFYSPSSVQLQILSGSLTTQTGPSYTLGASATIFLAIRLTTTSPGLSTVDSYLRIYPSGSTTTHTDYRLTFKMT